MTDIREDMRDLRRDFDYGTLDVSQVPEDPIELLKKWMNDAIALKVKDANAFILSTVNNGKPDSRVLLIRDIVSDGIHFYTNYTSKKSEDIAHNENAALNIFWPDLDRQIRIHADVKKLPAELSDDYFRTRPRASQIGAWASKQSRKLENRVELEGRINELNERFEGMDVPRPEFWGGYSANPDYIEFWQGRPSRLHDRITYTKKKSSWEIERLYP